MPQPATPKQTLLQAHHLKKVFRSGAQDLVLFSDLSLHLDEGEMLAIIGESGSGKSSLLHILGTLDRPSAGEVFFAGQPLHTLRNDAAADFRGSQIGFVWQFHYLLPEFTALENVAMPLLMKGTRRADALEQAAIWLQHVGLSARATHRSGELSGGEQQRIALARALITGPKLLMADEPTGDLDARTAGMVFDLISRMHSEFHLTSLIVTHSHDFARRCDRALLLRDGILAPSTDF